MRPLPLQSSSADEKCFQIPGLGRTAPIRATLLRSGRVSLLFHFGTKLRAVLVPVGLASGTRRRRDIGPVYGTSSVLVWF